MKSILVSKARTLDVILTYEMKDVIDQRGQVVELVMMAGFLLHAELNQKQDTCQWSDIKPVLCKNLFLQFYYLPTTIGLAG